MKNITLWAITLLLLLPLTSIEGQDSKGRKLADLSSKEKMQILANQIQLREDRIETMEKEITRLQKRGNKSPKNTSAIEKKLQKSADQLQTTEAQLSTAKAENEKLQALVFQLESQVTEKSDPSTTSSSSSTEQVTELQNKLSRVESENVTLLAKLKVTEDQLNEKQLQIIGLQNNQQSYTASSIAAVSTSKKRKNKNKYEEPPIEKETVRGKNYFYITAAKNLNIDDNYGIEIGSIKSFNKRSSKAVRLGLDVAYLSANLRNFDLDDIEAGLEEPTGSAGIKIGPNINVRLMKGIILNASYRFFPAANLTTVEDELEVEYKGFHTAGASLKIGPIMGRFEVDFTKDELTDQSVKLANAPMTVYLGLMF